MPKDNKQQRNLEKQAKEIMRIAEEYGVQSNYFFLTTFERYQVQLTNLTKLQQAMEEAGMLITKEYVKGRQNLTINPAVTEYNRTTDSANKTVSTLMRILKNFNVTETSDDDDIDPLMAIINGGNEDD